jgi:hypothetical protein
MICRQMQYNKKNKVAATSGVDLIVTPAKFYYGSWDRSTICPSSDSVRCSRLLELEIQELARARQVLRSRMMSDGVSQYEQAAVSFFLRNTHSQ